MFKPLERGVERKEKDDVDEWGDERVKHVESWPARPRGAQRVAEYGACDARADRARDVNSNAEREGKVDRDRTRGALLQAAWIFIFLIIWTQLFHSK